MRLFSWPYGPEAEREKIRHMLLSSLSVGSLLECGRHNACNLLAPGHEARATLLFEMVLQQSPGNEEALWWLDRARNKRANGNDNDARDLYWRGLIAEFSKDEDEQDRCLALYQRAAVLGYFPAMANFADLAFRGQFGQDVPAAVQFADSLLNIVAAAADADYFFPDILVDIHRNGREEVNALMQRCINEKDLNATEAWFYGRSSYITGVEEYIVSDDQTFLQLGWLVLCRSAGSMRPSYYATHFLREAMKRAHQTTNPFSKRFTPASC